MKKSTVIIIIIVAFTSLLLTLSVVYLRQYLPKYRWYPAYNYKSEQPYDTKYLFETLKKTYPANKFVMVNKQPQLVIDENETNSCLFYIGYNTFYDSITIDWFEDYLYMGNTICIASDYLPYQLLDNLFQINSDMINLQGYYDSLVVTHFLDDSLRKFQFHFQYQKRKTSTNWNFFSDTSVFNLRENSICQPLSVIDTSHINLVKFNYGKGTLFVFTNPILLTNYYFSTPEGLNYANAFFTHIGKPETLYWDNFSHYSSRPFNLNDADNPLEFILSKTSLRWAWYCFIMAIVLFILFKLKRRQKPVEILVPDRNASIEYAKALGLLHYKYSMPNELAIRLMKLFLSFVKERYHININDSEENQIIQISLRSNIEKQIVKKIYFEYSLIKYNLNPEMSQTLNLHNLLDYFYKNCK